MLYYVFFPINLSNWVIKLFNSGPIYIKKKYIFQVNHLFILCEEIKRKLVSFGFPITEVVIRLS